MPIIWLFLIQVFPISDQAEPPQVDYEARVPVVSFLVKVSENAKVVRSLEQAQFALQENQLAVNISNVEAVHLPISLEILVDLSSSHHDHLKQARNLCEEFIDNKAQEDQLKISSFSKIYLEWTPFTKDQHVLRQSLLKFRERSSTALYDTISKALDALSRQKGPKALVIITDGRDLMSTIPEAQLKARIKSYGIPIILLFTGKEPSKEAFLLYQQHRYLQSLVAQSNGFWFEARDGYSKALERTLKDLSFRYRISYQPPQPENLALWRRRKLSVNGNRHYMLSYSRGYRLQP